MFGKTFCTTSSSKWAWTYKQDGAYLLGTRVLYIDNKWSDSMQLKMVCLLQICKKSYSWIVGLMRLRVYCCVKYPDLLRKFAEKHFKRIRMAYYSQCSIKKKDKEFGILLSYGWRSLHFRFYLWHSSAKFNFQVDLNENLNCSMVNCTNTKRKAGLRIKEKLRAMRRIAWFFILSF